MLKEYLYCSQCGTKLDIAVPSFRLLLSSENLTEKEVIEAYFNSGFSYNTILCFLEKYRRRIPTFYAEFKTGFNFATAMATKHFITEGSMSCHSHEDVAMLDAENPGNGSFPGPFR